MTESTGPAAGDDGLRGMLDPMTRALAGLVLAVLGLMGSNVLVTGLQFLTEGGFGGDPTTYMFWLAVGSAIPLGLGLWLALPPARGAAVGWVASVARSAVLVAGLGLVGALLLLLGVLFSL